MTYNENENDKEFSGNDVPDSNDNMNFGNQEDIPETSSDMPAFDGVNVYNENEVNTEEQNNEITVKADAENSFDHNVQNVPQNAENSDAADNMSYYDRYYAQSRGYAEKNQDNQEKSYNYFNDYDFANNNQEKTASDNKTGYNQNPYANFGGNREYSNNHKQYEQAKNGRHTGLKVFGIVAASIAAVALCIGVAFLIFNGSSMILNKFGNVTEGDDNIKLEQNGSATSEIATAKPGEELTIPQISQKLQPSVVGIVASAMQGSASGTGIIMNEEGYIITNAHVVDGAQQLKVVLHDQQSYAARLVGSDAKSDLAVIKIEAKNLKAAEFGDSSKLVVGELAVAIGNPYGLDLAGSVTAGIISALDRTITVEDRQMHVLQTDASINPGNSGGPLINKYGQVIGINSIKIGAASNAEGLGFAIPINEAKPYIDSLIKNGYIKDRPIIGITGQDINEALSEYYNMPQGVYVRTVTANTDAAAKGIRPFDIIIKADGVEIKNMTELNAQKDKHKAGETMTLTIWRGGKTFDVKIVLGEDKPEINS